MNQLHLFIVILILILFLMYVYKKKCDEDYYISLIKFTQQQYINQVNSAYPSGQIYPTQYKASYKSNGLEHFNQKNDNFCYKTPKRKKTFHIYKDYTNDNENGQFWQEKNELNHIKNGLDNEHKEYEFSYSFDSNNKMMYTNYGKNKTEIIDKKIFKLEDFLCESKIDSIYDNKRRNIYYNEINV